MAKDKFTPLQIQYNQIKDKYPDTILLFRMGDFFETFDEDAVLTAKVCGITLTSRNNGAAEKSKLAGFPHHQLDNYLPKLVRGGYRVAVCEQLEDPKKSKGIVKRGVVEVVTPGVAIYDKLLESKANNFCASVYIYTNKKIRVAGIAFCDVSTGEFSATEVSPQKITEVLLNISPAEIIISKEQKLELLPFFQDLPNKPSLTTLEDWMFEYDFTRDILLRRFDTLNLKGFGVEDKAATTITAGVVLNYIIETRKNDSLNILSLSLYQPGDYMTLDSATRRNLEILYSMHDDKNSALINILDKTQTPQGGRLFKKWIAAPLRNLDAINYRRNAVDALFNDEENYSSLRNILGGIGDIERIISKITNRRAIPNDVINLSNSLKKIPFVKEILSKLNSNTLSDINSKLDDLTQMVQYIENSLLPDAATKFGNGHIFQKGVNEQLDEYVEAKENGKDWITKYRDAQRELTGINSLKISFNNVFGYYIEISRIHTAKVPETYNRKQTLTNSERYMTPELKEIETKILNAEYKIDELERQIFEEMLTRISFETKRIQILANYIATIDCLFSFTAASKEYNYVPAEIDDSEVIEFEEARHPVVEKLLSSGETFTPNNTNLDTAKSQLHIITGPNMSGKSCYLRQVALVVFMGQIGCYVPAKKAHFGLVDRIFTRVGAQDNITSGESTFLIEMQEAANILNNATQKSLILLDEVGRGTATTDGIAIAWGIAEYIHNEIGAKTLFATHYHELNQLAELYERVENFRIDVVGEGNNLVFTHNVKKGGSDKSFGIYVAKMAGVPYELIKRANEIMAILEGQDSELLQTQDTKKIKKKRGRYETSDGQLAIFEIRDDIIRDKLRAVNPENMTPIQALQYLLDLHKEAVK